MGGGPQKADERNKINSFTYEKGEASEGVQKSKNIANMYGSPLTYGDCHRNATRSTTELCVSSRIQGLVFNRSPRRSWVRNRQNMHASLSKCPIGLQRSRFDILHNWVEYQQNQQRIVSICCFWQLCTQCLNRSRSKGRSQIHPFVFSPRTAWLQPSGSTSGWQCNAR